MISNYALHSTNNTTAVESNTQPNTIMESELRNQEILNESSESDKSLLHSLCNNYTQNPFLLMELLLTFLYAGTSHFLLHWIFGMSTYERSIPYQETAEGDIILDLYVDRALVEKETVPDWVLLVICYPMSMVMVVIIAFSCGPGSMRRRCELHSGICTLLFSMGSTSIITTFGKNYVGKVLDSTFYSYYIYILFMLISLYISSNKIYNTTINEYLQDICAQTFTSTVITTPIPCPVKIKKLILESHSHPDIHPCHLVV